APDGPRTGDSSHRGARDRARLPVPVRGIHMLEFRFRARGRQLLSVGLLWSVASAVTAGGLADALQATLRHHPAVAGQAAEVEARRHAADSVRSQRYPTLSAQAQQYTQSTDSIVAGEDL